MLEKDGEEEVTDCQLLRTVMDHGDYDWATVLNMGLNSSVMIRFLLVMEDKIQKWSNIQPQRHRLVHCTHLRGHSAATDLQLFTFGLHGQMLRPKQGSANIYYNGPDNIWQVIFVGYPFSTTPKMCCFIQKPVIENM